MERDRPIGVAVLALSEEAPGQLVADRLGEAGLRVVERAVCADAEAPIRTRIDRWIADPTVDLVVVIGGSELSVDDATRDAVSDAVTRVVPGFGELVRWTSYDKLGTPAVLNRASAALCNSTLLVVLPGSAALVALVLESILLPQLDPTGAAPTLAMLLPRFAKNRQAAAKPKPPPPPPPGRTPPGGGVDSPPTKVVIEPRRDPAKLFESGKPVDPAKLFESTKPAETAAPAVEPPTLVDEPAVPAASLFVSEPAYDLRRGSRRIGRIALALAALAAISVAVAVVVVVAPWRREAASAPVAAEPPAARAHDAAIAPIAPPDVAEVAVAPEPEDVVAEKAPPPSPAPPRSPVPSRSPSPSPSPASPTPTLTPTQEGPSDVPEALDQGMVRVAVAQVKPLISACGEKAHIKGTVKVHVEVGPGGKVESTAVRDTPDDALGTCVAAALGRAHFPRTQTGGTFTYPFVFGG